MSDATLLTEQSLEVGRIVLGMAFASNAERPPADGHQRRLGSSYAFTVHPDTVARSLEAADDLVALRLRLEEGAQANLFAIAYDRSAYLKDGAGEDDGFSVVRNNGLNARKIFEGVVDISRRKMLTEATRLLERAASGAYKIAGAARQGDLAGIKRYAPTGVPDDEKRGALRGALAMAVKNGFPEAVKLLLEMGADPVALNSSNRVPLLDAALAGDTRIVQLLLIRMRDQSKDSSIAAIVAGSPRGQDLLAKIAVEAPDARRRFGAAAGINSPAALAKVASGAPDARLRAFAAAMAGARNDQATTGRVREAIFGVDWPTRREAVKSIQAEEVIAAIAEEDPVAAVRLVAVGRVADVTLLTEVANRDADPSVRVAAVEKISDQVILGRIARENSDPATRSAAIRKLSNATLLTSLAHDDPDGGVRQLAERRASVLRYYDQAALASAAIASSDCEFGREAVRHLTEQAQIARVATGSSNWLVRVAAIDRLTDQILLEKIGTGENDYLVRRLAISKMTNQAILIRIAEESDEVWLEATALSRITPETVESVEIKEENWKLLGTLSSLMVRDSERSLKVQPLIRMRAERKTTP